LVPVIPQGRVSPIAATGRAFCEKKGFADGLFWAISVNFV
jgi:hypothetical protein